MKLDDTFLARPALRGTQWDPRPGVFEVTPDIVRAYLSRGWELPEEWRVRVQEWDRTGWAVPFLWEA